MKINPNKLRKHVLDMVYEKQSGHIGGSFSMAEITAYLYNNYDLITPNKDKLILSKGHAVPILYAALYELGHIDTLNNFREVNSPLQGHPDKARLNLMHATTGALGQGLSIAIGHALACKTKKLDNKIFCVLGDGEIQEGQIWEAFMLAPKYGLDNLICFIDYNKAQNDGYVKDILDMGNLEAKIKGKDIYPPVDITSSILYFLITKKALMVNKRSTKRLNGNKKILFNFGVLTISILLTSSSKYLKPLLSVEIITLHFSRR